MKPTPRGRNLTATEERVEIGGFPSRRLRLAGAGTPFLLLHGFADSADTWRPLIAELAAAGRGADAIDLAGFGAAGPPASTDSLLSQWDRMVAAAIHGLSAEHAGAEVFVAGNSLGGSLALRAAERDDLPVAGIVPIAPAGLDMARWFPIIEGERLIRVLQRTPLPVPELVVRELVGRVYANLAFSAPARAPAEAVAAFTRHIPTVERSSAILDIGRRLLPELQRPFELERISCSLLLVWGENDRMVYTSGAERVLRTVPYSDIEIIPHCGHCPQIEVPERLARMLLDFPHAYEHP